MGALVRDFPLAREGRRVHLVRGTDGNHGWINEMAAAQAQGGQQASDRVFGAIGITMVVMGIVAFILSFGEGGSDTGAPAAAAVPVLAILSPAAGAELDQPAAVEIDAGATLVLGPTGWTADGRHLHLFAGGTELMAAATDLQPLGGTRYRWSLPRLAPGETTLNLAWSDERHRTIPDGASPAIRVRLR
jgi:hypothetical protein